MILLAGASLVAGLGPRQSRAAEPLSQEECVRRALAQWPEVAAQEALVQHFQDLYYQAIARRKPRVDLETAFGNRWFSSTYERAAEIGLAAERAGADGVVAINTVRALAIDIELRRPILSAGFGGLSGPAIKPIAVRAVAELYRALDVPVVGCGGVMGWRDAVELILAGASAIQVGSAVYYRGLGVFRAITSGLAAYMERMGYSSVADMVGDGVRELVRGRGA